VKDDLESVHLEDYPEVDEKLVKKNKDLLEEMSLVREIASIGGYTKLISLQQKVLLHELMLQSQSYLVLRCMFL